MHVAYIHQHFSPRAGSTGTRSYEMSQRLIKAGHTVTMICGVNPATREALNITDRISRFEVDGINVVCIDEPYANEMGFWRRVQAFRNFATQAQRVAVEAQPDLIFATSTPLTVGTPGKKAARKLGVPFVFEVRDLWPELPIALGVIKNPLIKWYLRGMERGIYKAARHIIGLSPGIVDGIVRAGYPRERVTMIPNCSDLDLFRPSDEPLNDQRFGPTDEFRCVFTGAHGLANGLDAVLDAAQVLKQRGVTDIRFVFIGSGRERDRLIERSREMQLDDLVLWHKPIPKAELAKVLPRMDVGLMILKDTPAFYYGTSPNKFFDYIACGLPVLNNYPGWLADMIGERKCGKAVPPSDPEAFADAVVWLRDHPEERVAMGKAGRELAQAKFDRDEHGARFVKVLEDASGQVK